MLNPRRTNGSRSRVRQAKRQYVAQLETLEPRLLLSADFEFRTIDGSNNNAENPDWGAASTQLVRIADADYPKNGSGNTIVNEFLYGPGGRANPRDISNAIADQGGQIVLSDRDLSDFVWQWGQFLDHDIDLTGTSSDNGTAEIPINDDADPLGPYIPFDRSDFDPQTGTNKHNPRQQRNQITSFIDASNVYGSDVNRAAALRTKVGGKLATSQGDLLPFNTQGLPNAGGDDDPELFLAGDVRANEQVALTAMHTLFVREHNRLADLLQPQMQGASDEAIYQVARKIVGAEMQIITYNEFLPALLGPGALPDYSGYQPTVDSSIANEFSTAFYRFGHSMLSPNLRLLGASPNQIDSLPLRDAFFNPEFLTESQHNLERLLRGLASQASQEIDNLLVDDVRNFLFGPPGAGGLDLASLNIQRGRDHGLPDYNELRVAYGLALVQDFADISSDPEIQAALGSVYSNVDNVDAWVGGLAEDHVSGSSVGELVHTALVDQFVRLRDGDRFFYLNDPDLQHPAVTAVIDLGQVTLANIIQLNTTINKHLPANVFLVSNSVTPAASLTGAEATQSDAAATIQLALLATVQEPFSQTPAQDGVDQRTGQQPTGEEFAADSANGTSVSTQVVDPVVASYDDVDDGALAALFGSLDAGWWHEELVAGLMDQLTGNA